MKKRILPLLMALCLTLSLVPMALAAEDQPDTITLPNGEVREIPTLEEAMNTAAAAELSAGTEVNGLNTVNGVIKINTMADFIALAEDQNTCLANNTIELNLPNKILDLSDLPCAEWSGYLKYFYGNIDGNGHTVKGFKNNCALIYAYYGGTIKDLTLEFDGNAGQLIFMPTSNPVLTNLSHITTTGYVTLTGSDQSNYSPFIYCSGTGGLRMADCTNEAEISGDIYGGIFYGYYPLYTNGISYEFTRCVNNADVAMRNAAIFFGNPTTINDKLASNALSLTITECENNAIIRGTVSAHYLAPSLDGADYPAASTALTAKEAAIMADSTNTLPAAPTVDQPSGLQTGNALTGFTYTIDTDKTIHFTVPSGGESGNSIAKYVVSVSSYVCWWNTLENRFDGAGDRATVVEEITANGSTSYTAGLKYYGFADDDYGEAGDDIGEYWTQTDGTNTYYTIKKYDETHPETMPQGKYQVYATRNLNADGKPGNGCVAPQFVTVAAVKSDGTIIDFATAAAEN